MSTATLVRESVKQAVNPKSVSLRALSTHLAPPRAPTAREEGIENMQGVLAALKGGDLNLTEQAAAKSLNRRVVAVGVLCLTVPKMGWKLVDVESHEVGSDHPAMVVVLKHRVKRITIRVLVINCMSVSTGEVHAAAILRKGIKLRCNLILGSECRDFWAAEVDRQGLYKWLQFGNKGSAESGVIIGVLKAKGKMKEPRIYTASRQTLEGGAPGIDHRRMIRALCTFWN